MANRASIIKARVANRGNGSGGTTAPPKAAGGPNVGQAHGFQMGVGGGGALPTPPPAPPAPKPAPHMPWDAQFELASAGAEKGYGDKQAYLGSKRLITQQGYGMDPGFNDYANNPFSRAALLRQSFDSATRGTTNSYAAGGHLYSGALHNAQGANRSSYDQNYDSLNREYLTDLGDIDREGAQALEDREGKINDAGWQRLQTAQSQPLEPETSPKVKQKAKQKHKDKKKGKR